MKEIHLPNGLITIVDDDDYDYLSLKKWNSDHLNYVRRIERINGKRKAVFMHRIINNTPDGFQTDHINNNPLDNRKENLRTVTGNQNKYNKSKYKKRKTDSKYKGVIFDSKTQKYVAYIQKNKKRKSIGYYKTEEEAATAYNNYAILLFGEYANLNEVVET